MIVHCCVLCGFMRANRIADDMAQADDVDAITGLMGPDTSRTPSIFNL